MSLPDPRILRLMTRRALVATMVVAAATAAGCTVRPLYSSDKAIQTGAIVGANAELRSIVIDEVRTRYGQELRNQLIFLFGGGSGQPAAPKYRMVLNVDVTVTNEAVVSVGDENRPTAALLQMTGTYVVTALDTDKPVATGSRSIISSYDQPPQEFANLRARRDAENRAARELAEIIRLDVAQRLARG
jgi:LPS-assembly lipoprotein